MRRIALAVILTLVLAVAYLVFHFGGQGIVGRPEKKALAAGAQPAGKQPRIALVFANASESELRGPNPTSAYARGFLDKMRELGWVDG